MAYADGFGSLENPNCNLLIMNTIFFVNVTLICYSLIALLISKEIDLHRKYESGVNTFAFVLAIISLVGSAATLSDVVGSTANVVTPVSKEATQKLLEFIFKDFVRKLIICIVCVAVFAIFAIVMIGVQDDPKFSNFIRSPEPRSDDLLAEFIEFLVNQTTIMK